MDQGVCGAKINRQLRRPTLQQVGEIHIGARFKASVNFAEAESMSFSEITDYELRIADCELRIEGLKNSIILVEDSNLKIPQFL